VHLYETHSGIDPPEQKEDLTSTSGPLAGLNMASSWFPENVNWVAAPVEMDAVPWKENGVVASLITTHRASVVLSPPASTLIGVPAGENKKLTLMESARATLETDAIPTTALKLSY